MAPKTYQRVNRYARCSIAALMSELIAHPGDTPEEQTKVEGILAHFAKRFHEGARIPYPLFNFNERFLLKLNAQADDYTIVEQEDGVRQYVRYYPPVLEGQTEEETIRIEVERIMKIAQEADLKWLAAEDPAREALKYRYLGSGQCLFDGGSFTLPAFCYEEEDGCIAWEKSPPFFTPQCKEVVQQDMQANPDRYIIEHKRRTEARIAREQHAQEQAARQTLEKEKAALTKEATRIVEETGRAAHESDEQVRKQIEEEEARILHLTARQVEEQLAKE